MILQDYIHNDIQDETGVEPQDDIQDRRFLGVSKEDFNWDFIQLKGCKIQAYKFSFIQKLDIEVNTNLYRLLDCYQ